MPESKDPRWVGRASRQMKGRQTEKKLLSEYDAVPHPMSGAGRIKFDGHNEETLYEIKDANKTFTLSAKFLQELYLKAVRQNREGVLLIFFRSNNYLAEIRIRPK